jgi:hypothetical protein
VIARAHGPVADVVSPEHVTGEGALISRAGAPTDPGHSR